MKKFYTSIRPYLFLIATILLSCNAVLGQKAFPDAIGFGSKSKGAYAGSREPKILIVDTLCAASVGNELTGRGSFAWAISRNYPRVILFEVSGNIALNAKLSITSPFVTIAGQSAPHPGITITNYPIIIYTREVIIQHLRFRLGDVSVGEGSFDTFSVYKGPNVYIDHCSFSWAVDENFSCSSTDLVKNVTISNCIISEALYATPHPDSPNSYGMLIYKGDSISIIRNLFVHLAARVPMVNNTANNVFIANNLLYNTGTKNSNIYFNTNSVPLTASVIGNRLIRGRESLPVKIIQVKSDLYSGTKIYLEDNEDIGRTTSPWSVVTGDTLRFRASVQNLRDNSFVPVSSKNLETILLPVVGARPSFRDAVDNRIIQEVKTRTGRMIDSQTDVGGFPLLALNKRKPQIPENPHADANHDNYTNLEEWLYRLHLELIGTTQAVNNPPQITDQSFSILDSMQNGTGIGFIKALDPDPGQKVSFSIIAGNDQSRYAIDVNSGELKLLKQTTAATVIQDLLKIQVSDNGTGNLTASATITVKISHYNIPVQASASVIYIDPDNENDTDQNGSKEHPYDSWKDVTWENGKTYLQKRNTTAHEGKINILANDVLVSAYGEGKPPEIISSATDFAFQVFSKSTFRINELVVKAQNAISCLYFLDAGKDSIVIEHCAFEGADNGIRVIDGVNLIIRYSTFNYLQEAIYLIADKADIYYNKFQDNSTAINLGSQSSHATIFNNVFYGNHQGIASTYGGFALYNNIFYLKRAGDMAINADMDEFVSDHNLFYPEQHGFIVIADNPVGTLEQIQTQEEKELNSVVNDPLFKDKDQGDFRVAINSPVIDAGKNIRSLPDYFGNQVPKGNAPDIGLEEKMQQNKFIVRDETDIVEEMLHVYPNPSNGKFNLDMNFETPGKIEYEVVDGSGYRLFKESLSPVQNGTILNIDLSDKVNAGIYFLIMRTGKLLLSRKIIIY